MPLIINTVLHINFKLWENLVHINFNLIHLNKSNHLSLLNYFIKRFLPFISRSALYIRFINSNECNCINWILVPLISMICLGLIPHYRWVKPMYATLSQLSAIKTCIWKGMESKQQKFWWKYIIYHVKFWPIFDLYLEP